MSNGWKSSASTNSVYVGDLLCTEHILSVTACHSVSVAFDRTTCSYNFGGVDSESLQEGNKACATRTLLCDGGTSPKSQKVPSGGIFSLHEDSENTIIILILETTVSNELEEVKFVVLAVEIVAVVDVPSEIALDPRM